MGRAIAVRTARHAWASREEAEAACREILRGHGYSPGDSLSDPADIAILEDLLSIHPHAIEKAGVGVSHFEIRHLSGTPGQVVSNDDVAFWVVRTDGTSTEFSYVEAIRPSDKKKQLTTALRLLVDDRRRAYRQRRFKEGTAVSDISGAEFTKRADAYVIYENPSFSQLVYRFIETEGGWDGVALADVSSAGFVGDRLASVDVENRWLQFYDTYASPTLATRSESARRPRVDEQDWTP